MHRSLPWILRMLPAPWVLVAMTADAAAAGTFPERPVRIVVPSAPGGGTDLIARLLAPRASEIWNQAVIVHNRGGGGTTIGSHLVAKATPDGYTVLMTAANFSMIPAINTKLPYDPQTDFLPVMAVAAQPSLMAVNVNLPVQSVNELVTLARAKPRQVRFGSGGNGTPNHFAIELFKMVAKIDLAHIPYNGTGPSVTALLGGEIQLLMTNVATLLPHVKAGRLRPLAVNTRARAAPDIPTFAEAGFKGYSFQSWYGMWVPRGTPSERVRAINQTFNQALKAPEVVARFVEPGIDALGGSPEQFTAFVAAEISKWQEVARRAGIKGD
jgi:tripartite-type tricarboxylate transporter receptor subunit TctC